MKSVNPRVVTAQILPLAEKVKIGVLFNGQLQIWDSSKGWGLWYRSHEFRAVRNATAGEIEDNRVRLDEWSKPPESV